MKGMRFFGGPARIVFRGMEWAARLRRIGMHSTISVIDVRSARRLSSHAEPALWAKKRKAR